MMLIKSRICVMLIMGIWFGLFIGGMKASDIEKIKDENENDQMAYTIETANHIIQEKLSHDEEEILQSKTREDCLFWNAR